MGGGQSSQTTVIVTASCVNLILYRWQVEAFLVQIKNRMITAEDCLSNHPLDVIVIILHVIFAQSQRSQEEEESHTKMLILPQWERFFEKFVRNQAHRDFQVKRPLVCVIDLESIVHSSGLQVLGEFVLSFHQKTWSFRQCRPHIPGSMNPTIDCKSDFIYGCQTDGAGESKLRSSPVQSQRDAQTLWTLSDTCTCIAQASAHLVTSPCAGGPALL